jgi:hypothetical protein
MARKKTRRRVQRHLLECKQAEITMHTSSKIIAVALMTPAAPWFVSTASALPASSSLGVHTSVASQYEAAR